jgi:hypothetical protein
MIRRPLPRRSLVRERDEDELFLRYHDWGTGAHAKLLDTTKRVTLEQWVRRERADRSGGDAHQSSSVCREVRWLFCRHAVPLH